MSLNTLLQELLVDQEKNIFYKILLLLKKKEGRYVEKDILIKRKVL